MLSGDPDERDIQEGGDMCIYMADSLCRMAETSTELWNNFTLQ